MLVNKPSASAGHEDVSQSCGKLRRFPRSPEREGDRLDLLKTLEFILLSKKEFHMSHKHTFTRVTVRVCSDN